MESFNYSNITNKEQYKEYANKLKELLGNSDITANYDEIELLTFLVDKWKLEQSSFGGLDPIEYLKSLMLMHKLKSKHLVDILGLSKELISDIINYRKGLSKDNIQVLSKYFNISPEAFSRPYKLRSPIKSRSGKPGDMTGEEK